MRIISLTCKPIYDLILLSILLALLFGLSLGDRPYSAPSESRYIEIGREMAESGDFVTPRLDYVKYFEKPPLFYWIQAEFTRHFGLSTFLARIPTAIFTIMLCLLTYGLGRMLYGRLAGLLGALTLATNLYIFAHAGIVLLDMPVSVFLTATLTCFLYAKDAPPSKMRTAIIYLMYAAAAGAVLTKGLIGAVLPGAIIFLWLACTKRWSLLRDMRLVSGTALFLLLATPWHIIVAHRNPEWAWFYFIHEHWLRYVTPEAGRDKPFWFFGAMLLGGWFPWVAFLAQSTGPTFKTFWQQRMKDSTPLFLVLWIGFIFLFYSLSHSKLPSYIIPIFPPIAVMLGRYLAGAWKETPTPYFKTGFGVFICLLVALAVAPTLMLSYMDKNSKVAVALTQAGDDVQYLSFTAMTAAGFLLIIYIQGRLRHLIIAMLAIAALMLQMGNQVAAHYNQDSMQSFGSFLNSYYKSGDEVAMYHVYYQDMPIYIGKRVTIAGWRGELEFGTEHENTSTWMQDDDTFWKRWLKNDHRMFVVMREDAFKTLTKDKTMESLHLNYLLLDGRNMLFMNQPYKPLTQKNTP